VFVKSQQYRRILDPESRGQGWSTGPVKVGGFDTKGTLLEPGVGGPGGGLVPPDYRPGVVQKLFEPLSVVDLIPAAPTSGSQVRYVVEGTATSGAAGVAEAGTKPESTVAMSETIEPVRKLATVLPVSTELLEDAVSVQSYLNTRLQLFVRLEEERQVLRGAGTNELVGLFGRAGLLTYARGTVDNNAVAVLKAAAGYRGTVGLDADAVVMHPSNWLATRLLTDAQQQFYGGGPFDSNAGFTGVPLWGLRVAVSSNVGAGTALLGSFGQAAQIWRRGALTVDASESHQDYFIRNLAMIRAEERLALGVFRPFVQVTGLA
jgi:HK97 family phage major capsid protein